MAVAAGPMIVGAVGWEGEEDRLEFTVIGTAVNQAAKLEKQTKAEKVCALTTRETLETALVQGYKPATDLDARPGIAVGGVEDPIDLIVLA